MSKSGNFTGSYKSLADTTNSPSAQKTGQHPTSDINTTMAGFVVVVRRKGSMFVGDILSQRQVVPQTAKRYFSSSSGGTVASYIKNDDLVNNIDEVDHIITKGKNAKKVRYLTKLLFQLACTCPRKLLYSLQDEKYPRRVDDGGSNIFLQNMADEGRQLEKYCQLVLFPNGTEIGRKRKRCNNSTISVENGTPNETEEDALVKETRALLESSQSSSNEGVTIFEGAIRH
eukprot:4173602-Ditylum_brightwellii.AAC.1